VKLSAARDELLAQLQTVSRVASTRGAIQALSGVQILADSSGVELRATDMEVGLRVPLPAQVEREGSIVLPARLLVDVVRSLSGPTVALELRAAEQDVELVAGTRPSTSAPCGARTSHPSQSRRKTAPSAFPRRRSSRRSSRSRDRPRATRHARS